MTEYHRTLWFRTSHGVQLCSWVINYSYTLPNSKNMFQSFTLALNNIENNLLR